MPSITSAGGGIAPKVRPATAVREDRGDGPRLVLSTVMVATRGSSTIGRRASRDFPDQAFVRYALSLCDGHRPSSQAMAAASGSSSLSNRLRGDPLGEPK